MSDNNADYNGSGQDNYYASNDSAQADFGQFQDGRNQPAAQPYNPNPYASQQPVQGYAPGTQGNNIPGGTYGNGQPYGQSLPTVRPSPHMARPLPLTGSRLSLRNLHSPSTASRRMDLRITHNRRRPPIIRSRLSPIHAVRIQSATNLRAADLLSGDQQQPGYGYAQKSKIVAGLLGLFLGTLGVHNFYLGYTGKAVAQLLLTLIGWIILIGPIISGIWALIEAVLILCSSYGSNWHRDGHGQELQD